MNAMKQLSNHAKQLSRGIYSADDVSSMDLPLATCIGPQNSQIVTYIYKIQHYPDVYKIPSVRMKKVNLPKQHKVLIDYVWTKLSVKELQLIMPGHSGRTIQRRIHWLLKTELLFHAKLSSLKVDRTNWYAINRDKYYSLKMRGHKLMTDRKEDLD